MALSVLVLIIPYIDPNMLPLLQVDKGAIKFILSGANIMCPGLTSPGARMDTPVEERKVVVSSHSLQVEASCCNAGKITSWLSLTLYCPYYTPGYNG